MQDPGSNALWDGSELLVTDPPGSCLGDEQIDCPNLVLGGICNKADAADRESPTKLIEFLSKLFTAR